MIVTSNIYILVLDNKNKLYVATALLFRMWLVYLK